MKRVRFETPTKSPNFEAMNDFECQSPRPFIEKKITPIIPNVKFDFATVLPYNKDPVQRYECGNGSPYPMVNKTCLTNISKIESKWTPSNDLELSLLDSFGQKLLRNSNLQESNMCKHLSQDVSAITEKNNCSHKIDRNSRVLSSLENKHPNPPNILNKHDDFFLRRDNIQRLPNQSLDSRFKKLTLEKENSSTFTKSEVMKKNLQKSPTPVGIINYQIPAHSVPLAEDHCRCHDCIITEMNSPSCNNFRAGGHIHSTSPINIASYCSQSCLRSTSNNYIHCNCNVPVCNKVYKKCSCESNNLIMGDKNTVEKKTWALKKYEESKDTDTVDTQKQVSKERREPTVADLFKIIKLQNEQLQLLQDKVDKFISGSKFEPKRQPLPLHNCVTEHVAVETVDEKHHKISIGVMTSFEVVHTSRIINKEIMKQSSEAEIQCNRSQISIKEVQPTNLNFLDGIMPVQQNENNEERKSLSFYENNQPHSSNTCKKDDVYEEKTLNEMSLYNVQVDNAITPLMSPDQSLYLDVRDYSDSESDPDDQSNVGWTYYNKVMTHVNGMLHDSDMPSSASALYRNTRQKCMQMKFDKTNVSVIKRVKFGDEALGIQQQHLTASTDTSLKMNQLAAKYLKNASLQTRLGVSHTPTAAPIDMSFATRNYMEKHQLLQGLPMKSNSAWATEIPRFLDVTALKQQPKLL